MVWVNNIKTFLITLCFLMISNANAQYMIEENKVGTNHFISSEILGEERRIQIYLPEDYMISEQEYPVLYILDGQRFFSYGVSLSKSFKQFQLTPDFIIVGIDNDYPQRFKDLGEDKVNFIEFLKKELLPYVDSKFRTSSERVLFGWEFGGSLVFNTMLSDPLLFNGYIMASAYPIMDAIDKLNDVSMLHTNLFFSTSPDEYEVRHSAVKLDSLLSQKHIEKLQWSFLKLDLEQHRSTGYPTLYHGLKNYYEYYPEFEINNLQKFINAGGLDYAYQYTNERANRYGFPQELSLWSRFTIVRSAMRAEDFYHFETLLNALNKRELINELIRDNREYAVANFAAFYEKNNLFKDAIDLYDLLLKKHPDSETLQKRKENAIKASAKYGKIGL